jgi:phosphoribosylformylglycinamidine cyclo-ligase
VVLAMASSGLHSNGYSLVRHVLLAPLSRGGAGWSLDRHVDELGCSLGEELLEPTRIYAKACLDLARSTRTHAMSHITGGGLAANLERVMPEELVATLDRGTWTPQPVFDVVRRVGSVDQADLEKTLNCGVGMVALVAPDDVDSAITLLDGYGVRAWAAGEVSAATGAAAAPAGGSVTLTGQYAGW